MIDRQQASEALAEVSGRQNQVSAMVWRRGVPAWLVGVLAAILLLLAVASDVRSQIPSWNGPFLKWGVPVLGVLTMLTLVLVVMHRRLGLRPHGPAGRAYLALSWLPAAYFVLAIAIGIPLRANDVSWDQTLSGVPAMAIVLAVGAVWRTVGIRRADGQR
ncbi:hypothetical protein CFN78_26075 [Amycolatopsis antarctica]|uniref:Uncharacterized protein n=1 Tax=Amycolatopsis antarctica TaxID=1854586 RepID=A0A263CY93_9PSEU|nr:hypothetical protein [Amycolatopsis antarctica]OZM70387.1 hypothetical protein CFN78_26075 [Amycolatopsis antarctica]